MTTHDLYAARTLNELLAVDVHGPAFGMVYQSTTEWRWMVAMNPGTFPPVPDDRRVGEVFYDHVRRLDLAGLSSIPLTVEGWLFVAQAWYVDNPWPAAEGMLRDHPRRQSSTIALYLDQHTGSITSRLTHVDGRINTRTTPRPSTGWKPDDHGTLAAALDLWRAACST